MTRQIVDEIVKLLERSEEDAGIIAIINSWRDTLPDDEILRLLREYNDNREAFMVKFADSDD